MTGLNCFSLLGLHAGCTEFSAAEQQEKEANGIYLEVGTSDITMGSCQASKRDDGFVENCGQERLRTEHSPGAWNCTWFHGVFECYLDYTMLLSLL